MILSFVITSFNREVLILRTIDSILNQSTSSSLYEIIIIDDLSSDNTVKVLLNNYENEIDTGLIKVILNKENIGVTGSKNRGYEESAGDWVIFIDSDDLLVPDILPNMLCEFNDAPNSPIIFFRCCDEEKKFVGVKFDNKKILGIKEYVENTSFGEALTCINKNIVSELPYVSELRGYEGLGCSRIILRYGPSILSTVVARTYDTSGDDRLSSFVAFRKRSFLLCSGHFMYLKEFSTFMSYSLKFKYILKIIFYFSFGLYNKLIAKLKKEG